MDRTEQEAFALGLRAGGPLCLGFVNTVRGRVSRGPAFAIVGERLGTYEALLLWSGQAGILTPGEMRSLMDEAKRRPRTAAALLRRAITVREAIFRTFLAAIRQEQPRRADLEIVSRELRIARSHQRLAASSPFRWELDDDRRALGRVLWPVMLSTAELLTSEDLERVGSCPGEECGWLFLDSSRSRRRRWCDMAECGNLDKVRRFRQRRGALR
jgi:predicted RNA-binding Zn ribbon-like protein